jgi:hypothetical protein
MALPLKAHTNQYKFGRGKLYIDLLTAAGAKVGERFIGNCPGFVLSVESEKFDHFSSTAGLRSKDKTVTLAVDFGAQITCDDVTKDNLALFLGGTVETITQSATPVANEAITVKKGYEYQLGATSSNPVGVQKVGSVVVTDVAGTTTYVLNTDYALDADSARILIIAAGAIANDQVIHVDYTPVAGTIQRVTSGTAGALDAAIRFIAANASGENDNLYIPLCSVAPSGELPFITEDDLASFTLDLGVSTLNSNTKQIYIDGVLVAS